MAGTRKKLPVKRPVERQRRRATGDAKGQLHLRPVNEARSKYKNDDWRVQSRADGKGKAMAETSQPNKCRKRSSPEEVEEESEELEPNSYETSTEVYTGSSVRSIESKSDASDEDKEDEDMTVLDAAPKPLVKNPRVKVKKETQCMQDPQWKQIVMVDKRGKPYGTGADYLAKEVKKFAKTLNPLYGWGDQPLADKKRFFDHIYADWEVRGSATEITPSWFPQYVTKTLINVRHNLMKMIDTGAEKPLEVDPDVWLALEAKRKTREAQEKSAKMRSISKGKSTKEAQMRAIEKNMIGELTLLLKRIPYEGEVKEATEKEYARRMAECSKAPMDYSKDIQQLQASTSQVGGRLSQLEKTIQQLILSLGDKFHQQDLIMSAPGGTVCTMTDDVARDVAPTEHAVEDIFGDAADVAIEARDVVNGSAEDMDTEVDYLVDEVTHDGVKEAETVVVDASEGVDAEDNSTAALTPIANAGPSEGNMASHVVSDLYNIVPKSTSTGTVAETPAPEVLPLPTSASSSRSNRVTRNMAPTKPTKFIAPNKATKAAATKLSKPSPPKAADPPRKGASPRKK